MTLKSVPKSEFVSGLAPPGGAYRPRNAPMIENLTKTDTNKLHDCEQQFQKSTLVGAWPGGLRETFTIHFPFTVFPTYIRWILLTTCTFVIPFDTILHAMKGQTKTNMDNKRHSETAKGIQELRGTKGPNTDNSRHAGTTADIQGDTRTTKNSKGQTRTTDDIQHTMYHTLDVVYHV